MLLFNQKKVTMLREEKITLTPFAKEHLQMVVQIGHFKTTEAYIEHFDNLQHQQYLVFYVNGGNAILVHDQDYHALSGSYTLIIKQRHDFSIFLDDCEVFYAILDGKHIEEFIHHQKAMFDLRFSKKTEIFFHSIFQSLDKYHRIDEFSISSAVLRFYSDIHIELHEWKPWSDKQEMIDKAVTFMEEHYQQDIKLKDISETSGYSEYYFLRIFKEIMLMTPYEYLIRKRLSQVKILLLSTHKTIEEIALLCGFKSDISLYKTFKNTYSITPREYKKAVGK